VSLLGADATSGTADSAAMVEARDRFLISGAYGSIAAAVATAAERFAPRQGCVVDLGGGTAYYLAAVLERLSDRTGLSLDISKHAARRAAKAHPRAAAVVCDAWRTLPVRDGVAAVVLSVFSPRNPGEIARVLGPSGAFVVVTPTDRHLAELIGPLGLLSVDERKRERLDDKLRSRFEQVDETAVEHPMALDRANVAALVAMGPSSYHLDPTVASQRVANLPEPTAVTTSVTISVFRSTAPR
jgi:23S rRNA (guanine745-N1)-methyltransferase